MKTIGLLGGMSWESTVTYYQEINLEVRRRLGKLHSAKLLINSVDFQPIADWQAAGAWELAGKSLASAAIAVEQGGADCIVLATNTMHKVAEQIELAVHVPLIHIADATSRVAREQGIEHVGLLGTRFTMEQDFYHERLRRNGLGVRTPTAADREFVHDTIYNELCHGRLNDSSRERFAQIIDDLSRPHATDGPACQAVILGCTEIGLLVDSNSSPLPPLDTTLIHSKAAVDFALAE